MKRAGGVGRCRSRTMRQRQPDVAASFSAIRDRRHAAVCLRDHRDDRQVQPRAAPFARGICSTEPLDCAVGVEQLRKRRGRAHVGIDERALVVGPGRRLDRLRAQRPVE